MSEEKPMPKTWKEVAEAWDRAAKAWDEAAEGPLDSLFRRLFGDDKQP